MADNPSKKKETSANANPAESLKVQDLSQVVDRSTRTLHELDERLRSLRTELAGAIGKAGIPLPASAGGAQQMSGFTPQAWSLGGEAAARSGGQGASGQTPAPFQGGQPGGAAGWQGNLQQGSGFQQSPFQQPFQPQGPFQNPFPQPSPFQQAPQQQNPFLQQVPLPLAAAFPAFGIPPTGAPFGIPPQLQAFAGPFQTNPAGQGPPTAPWASQTPFQVGGSQAQGTFSGQGPSSSFGSLGGPGGALGATGQQGLTRSTRDRAEQPPVNRQPAVDIVDEGSDYQLQMDMPGVGKENLDIMATDRAVIVTATAKPETGDGMLVLGERETVVYRRTIPLPAEIKTSDCKASLKNGVLTLTVPKKNPTAGPKHVDVAFG